MANKKVTMTDLRLLIRKFNKGTYKRKISEILNLSRTSIDVYLEAYEKANSYSFHNVYGPAGEMQVDLERVAIHCRRFTNEYTTDPSHMPPKHLAYMRTREWYGAGLSAFRHYNNRYLYPSEE